MDALAYLFADYQGHNPFIFFFAQYEKGNNMTK